MRGGRRVPLTIGVAHACTVKCRLDEVADARRLEQAPVAAQGGGAAADKSSSGACGMLA